jgi:hypothetical protein
MHMQIDFHHAATYAVARLAGFTHNDATTIAYASQYVDDSTNKGIIEFTNGTIYDRIASAHKVFDVEHNCLNSEDYEVWVPFHFLPGNNGAPADTKQYVPLSQRLVCTPDSPLSADMWDQCRAKRGDSNGLHRLGITAHVYCDTFSHQMFAGIRHQVNRVADLQHVAPADTGILERIESAAADDLGLGHGGALTDPDLPYLAWRYTTGFQQPRTVSNQDAFLLASKRLFSQFIYYLGRDSNTAMDSQDMGMIEHLIASNVNSDPNSRHRSWLEAIREGSFSFGKLSDVEFHAMNYLPYGDGSWKFLALGTTEAHDTANQKLHYDERFEASDWKKFHDALKGHQFTVLNVIFPKYQLPRSYEEAKASGL